MKYIAAAIISFALATSTVADECSNRCNADFSACEKAQGAGNADCSTKYTACLGYDPLADKNKISVPTACSKGPVLPAATKVTVNDPCAAKCNADFGACEKAQGAGNADCSTKYTACLGYDPLADKNKISVPTACSKGPVLPAATKVTVNDPCAAKCNADFGACEMAQGAGNADCSAKYTACLGYDPLADKNSISVPTACKGAGAGPTGAIAPVVVAGSSSLEPALAMLALGAVALF